MFYAIEKTLFQVPGAIRECDSSGLPETLLLRTKLVQILFDKYISFRKCHTVVPSIDHLYNFITKFAIVPYT